MKIAVDTGLPEMDAPLEWAVQSDNMLYTSQIPMRCDGSIEDGAVASQTQTTLKNLKQTLEAAGGSMDDVTQVVIYLVPGTDFSEVNRVYQSFFNPPYPNRATVIVAELLIPGAAIEIVAYAHLAEPMGSPSAGLTPND